MSESDLIITQEMTYIDTDGEVIGIMDHEEAMEYAITAKLENPDKVIIVIPGRIIITDEKTEAKENFGRSIYN